MPGPYSCGAFVLQEHFLHAKLICLGVQHGWFGKSDAPGPCRAAPRPGAEGQWWQGAEAKGDPAAGFRDRLPGGVRGLHTGH